jgi:RNA polymerase sigma-70 factor, ECF subfamily
MSGNMETGEQAQPEQALLELAQDGDQGAFGELVGPYQAELHAHGYRMLGSVHDAEDVLQDALLRAWRGLPGFEGRSSVRSWLHTILSNAALDLTRRRARREVPAGFSPGGHLAEPPWLEP